MLAASVTLLVASDHEHRAFLHPSAAARRCTGGVMTMARPSSFLARKPHDSSPRGVAHPHGFPQMSHVIPRHVFQTLKSGRCNSNVFSAHQKLTEGNYVRLFGEERLPPADEAGTPQADARMVMAREPPASPVTPVGAPGNPRPRRDAPFISTRPGLVQRSQPQYANPLGCSAKTANPGSTTSKPLAL